MTSLFPSLVETQDASCITDQVKHSDVQCATDTLKKTVDTSV